MTSSSEMAAAPVPILMYSSSSSSSSSSSPFHRPMSLSMGSIKTLPSICPSPSPSPPPPLKTKCLLSRSSDTKPEEDDNTTAFSSPEDVNYLWKLGAGSVGGAALIKYGSVLLPEITKPNILLALFMISAPMVVATLLLIKQSRVAEQNKDPI